MQGKIQQHIQQLMKDHKRRSMWKRATAVLSAVVLLSTFLSLRNFAIAVTEEKATEAQITEAVQAALAETASAKENNGVTVTNEFTPEAPVITLRRPDAFRDLLPFQPLGKYGTMLNLLAASILPQIPHS